MKTIKLNLMLNYPVRWTKWQVLRDIIQNFYDEAGYEQFGKVFRYEYNDTSNSHGNLVLSMKSSGFNYEWLIHIGATTKQESREKYAGFYGEGFKVAAMCALRDFSWKIEVRSRNWRLSVVKLDTDIDGKLLQQLAYHIEENLDNSDQTIITISDFCKEDLPIVESATNNFYYPENPLFGEKIWSDARGAIYKRSNHPKPKSFPASFGCGGDGIVYLAYQVRGSFVQPFVLCDHYFKTKDRDRKTIGIGTVQDTLIDLSYHMSAEAAILLLEALSKYWYSYPSKKEDVESWYAVIRKLIIHLSWDGAISQFREQNPNLAVCEKPTNKTMEWRRSQALRWQKAYRPDLKIVQENFSLLGYPTIIELCEKAGGFNVTRKPKPKEKEALDILLNAAKNVLKGFVFDFPSCLVIDNESSINSGTAITTPDKKNRVNSKGFKIRYVIHHIEIKKRLLRGDCFMEAFAVYCHELCHCFGGDASKSFSNALTDVIALTVQKQNALKKYHDEWLSHFAAE